MVNDNNEKKQPIKEVYNFSVWKTNIALTGLFAWWSLFSVNTAKLTAAHSPVLIESILFSQSEMSRSAEIALSLVALVSITLSSLLFVYVAWNYFISRIVNCRRISIGQAYTLIILLVGVVSTVQ